MVSMRKLLAVAGVALAVLIVASFVGGSVGALIFGREPVAILAVGPPHVELPPGHPFGVLPVTNTLLASWLTGGVLLALFALATRRVQLVPVGLQNMAELVCEYAAGFIEGLVGKENEKRFFPVVMTVFLFVLLNAWLCLIPGFESLKLGGVPLLRSANTDINVPLMLALLCVLLIEYWGLRAQGLSYLKTFFDLGRLGSGVLRLMRGEFREGLAGVFYGILFAFVGLLELLGHMVRVVSFSFRLFGNMTAGVVLTGVVLFLVPLVLPSVFYGLEALFGLVQALIFAGLTAIFGYAAVGAKEY